MMNKESIPPERRSHPRIPQKLHIDLHSDESEFQVESVNLSRNGVYCKVDHAIPFMANVKISMTLPENENKTEHKSDKIQCGGVVVRVDEHADSTDCNGGCRVAIFFYEIGEYEQQKLDAYIAERL